MTKSALEAPALQTPALATRGLIAGYGERPVLNDINLSIPYGGITTLVGPNGSGKSTLLRTIARLLRPSGGQVLLDGAAIRSLTTTQVARRMAILPQSPEAPGTLTVRELVEQGRFPHVGALRMLRAQDHAAITVALAQTGMSGFAHRPVDALSGGERQRAWIALALAQDTPILLLDEPTTFLDLGHQLEVLDLVRSLNRDRNMTVVMVLHDLNQAARYSDRMIVLQAGRVVADNAPSRVLTEQILGQVFNIRASIVTDPVTGTPVCLPYALAAPKTALAAE